MADRPFLEPHIRFVVNVPQAEERFTASVEDTLQAEVSKQTRERGIRTAGGIITNFIIEDEVVFDIEDDTASVEKINIIQEEIINAFNNFTEVNVDEQDIVVRADIIRIVGPTTDPFGFLRPFE